MMVWLGFTARAALVWRMVSPLRLESIGARASAQWALDYRRYSMAYVTE
jgi:hypothetical protein